MYIKLDAFWQGGRLACRSRSARRRTIATSSGESMRSPPAATTFGDIRVTDGRPALRQDLRAPPRRGRVALSRVPGGRRECPASNLGRCRRGNHQGTPEGIVGSALKEFRRWSVEVNLGVAKLSRDQAESTLEDAVALASAAEPATTRPRRRRSAGVVPGRCGRRGSPGEAPSPDSAGQQGGASDGPPRVALVAGYYGDQASLAFAMLDEYAVAATPMAANDVRTQLDLPFPSRS